jgi:transcription antitermination factor NusG
MVPVSGSEANTVTPLVTQSKAKWYAVYTSPRAEKKVNTRLTEAGIETYLPIQRTYRQWSDRKKLVEKPLISSYLFVKVVPLDFQKVFRTSGVVKFISFEGKPVPIPENQINNLRLLVNSDAKIQVTTEQFEKGDLVSVVAGSCIGLKGELIKCHGKKRFIVRIDCLDHNLIVEISPAFLKKIKS